MGAQQQAHALSGLGGIPHEQGFRDAMCQWRHDAA